MFVDMDDCTTPAAMSAFVWFTCVAAMKSVKLEAKPALNVSVVLLSESIVSVQMYPTSRTTAFAGIVRAVS